MGGWARWSAGRRVVGGAAVPRAFGVDGRPLVRPWRVRAEGVVAEAARRRAARPQPGWPKVLGWVCIAVALWWATMPAAPVPRHVPLSAAARPVPEGSSPAPLAFRPSGAFAPADATGPTPHTVVVLAGDYRELARFAATGAPPWRLPEGLRARLDPGQPHHVYALAGQDRDTVRSRLSTFVPE